MIKSISNLILPPDILHQSQLRCFEIVYALMGVWRCLCHRHLQRKRYFYLVT